MITFGLTGGIAVGKSTVTKTLRANNIPVVDADVVARQMVAPGTIGLSMLKEAFGLDYILEDGTINRPALAELVFSNSQSLKTLNNIMGPIIEIESINQLNLFHNKGYDIVCYDAALLVETGNYKKYSPLILVQCSEDTQLTRLMSRNNLTREQAMARISAQMSTAEKVKFADFVIDSSGTIENSIKQTENIIHCLHVLNLKNKLESGEITYKQIPYPFRDSIANESPDE